MKLEEFVTECLVQIVKGVVCAQEQTKDTGAFINPQVHGCKDPTAAGEVHGYGGQVAYPVEFDVAIVASEQKGNTGKVGLEVLGIGLSTKRDSEQRIGTESRVRFKVPMLLPLHKHPQLMQLPPNHASMDSSPSQPV